MDGFTQVLMEVNPHVFQEVWTQKIGFYYQATMKTEWLYTIASGLFGRENISPTLVSIMLNFLVERLPSLGDMTDQQATIVLRFYKLTFSAVTQYPATNEPILTAHLSKLMMDCFPLTVKAKNPLHYLQLLRLLFRVVGAGGGRFELLCKEVLPLIHEMLEGLNRLLITSEGAARDLIVELCLTFPLRLTHLLPHLGYLMQPLVQAFRGGPDLVQQGLRTLELCIDNLNPAFLDPTMGNVLRELMEALHNHLKPLPGNHIVAHTTIRVLGKLGGRNRKLLYKEPALKWKEYSEPAKVPVSLGGFFEGVAVGPMSVLAAKSVRTAKPPYRLHAYTFLENCLTFIVQEAGPMSFVPFPHSQHFVSIGH
jgi:transformation/transcription domain-associated protein